MQGGRNMIEKEILRMEEMAQTHHIPIMQKEGIAFLQEYIVKHQVKHILEIGSAIGYSAIQMARMDSEIHVVTIERDVERYEEAVVNVASVNMQDRIHLICGDALETEIDGCFDLIFIDAAKAQYIRFFEKYEKYLSSKGVIVSDNLDFHGMVGHEDEIHNRNTRQLVKKIKKFVDYLKEHPNYETTFYHVGDGIAFSTRKKEDD